MARSYLAASLTMKLVFATFVVGLATSCLLEQFLMSSRTSSGNPGLLHELTRIVGAFSADGDDDTTIDHAREALGVAKLKMLGRSSATVCKA